ncbi:MAG: hypothetical protein ARM1_0123 [Candidatus Micrarchaeota archaeon]|nr:MAG: hypothetical protein ARM1_0123 [Candidatus Micrarchaeota archaeon]
MMHLDKLKVILEDRFDTVIDVSGLHACFTYIAKDGAQTLLIKLVDNIDSIKIDEADSIKKISYAIDATPIIIGNRNNRKTLDDDTISTRYSIYCVSEDGFLNYINSNLMFKTKRFFSKRLPISGTRIRRARMQIDLSMDELARLTGLSKNMIYKFEKGYCKTASLNTIKKIESILHTDIRDRSYKVNIYKNNIKERTLRLKYKPFKLIYIDRYKLEVSFIKDIRTIIKWSRVFKEINKNLYGNLPIVAYDGDDKVIEGIPVLNRSKIESSNMEAVVGYIKENTKYII